MFENNELICAERNLISKAKYPRSMFVRFKSILDVLKRDSSTSSLMDRLEKLYIENDQKHYEKLKESFEWVEQLFNHCKTSKFATHCMVKQQLKLLESILKFEEIPEPQQRDVRRLQNSFILRLQKLPWYFEITHLGRILNMMVNVVDLIARFEKSSFFNGWAEVKDLQGEVNLTKLMLTLPPQKISKMDCWTIAQKTGNCFQKFKVYENPSSNGNAKEYFGKYQQGKLEKLITPDCLNDIISGHISCLSNEMYERQECDIIFSYSFMRGHSNCKITSKSQPRSFPLTLEESYMSDSQALNDFYFRAYASNSPADWPYSCKEILDNIDRFFDLLTIEILNAEEQILPKKCPSSKSDPKKGSDEDIYCEWYANWLMTKTNKPKHTFTYPVAIEAFRKSSTHLARKKEYPHSTFIRWMRDYHKRKNR